MLLLADREAAGGRLAAGFGGGCQAAKRVDAARNWKEVVLATDVVKWFNAVMGYGMIQPDDGSQAVSIDIGAV